MRGVIILTEGRSGSNWLGSLTNSTKVMGVSQEWIDAVHLDIQPRDVSADKYIQAVVRHASTENGFFSIKMFPRHLHWFSMTYGRDVIRDLMKKHDVSFIFLTRDDRIRQAVSFSRALQSNQWTKLKSKRREEKYDFEQICRCYFGIGRSYDFWKSYLGVQNLNYQHFSYEALMPDPTPYIRAVVEQTGLSEVPDVETNLKIQRDSKTEEWCEQFLTEIQVRDFVGASASYYPKRKLSNYIRFIRGKPLKPVPYTFV